MSKYQSIIFVKPLPLCLFLVGKQLKPAKFVAQYSQLNTSTLTCNIEVKTSKYMIPASLRSSNIFSCHNIFLYE